MRDLFSDLPSPEAPPPPAEPHVFSVTEITQTVRRVLEEGIGQIWVEGEVSNYRKQASGHQYFTLKDGQSQLQCVLFSRQGMWRKAVPLSDGMQVTVRGSLTVYEARGQYQLNVQSVQAAGAGLLQAKFEALKRKLDAEGLFDSARKRPIPAFSRTIAIVTSPTGAALRDMLNVLGRRSPWVRVLISPVRVQGEGAAEEIASAIAELNHSAELGLPVPDLIITGRGGGSAEDLWEFNEEIVARAIAASTIPIISAVGHEIDFTISDFAADLRAPTPSAAAELAAPDRLELERRFSEWSARIERSVKVCLQQQTQHLLILARSALFREPRSRLDEAAQRIDHAWEAVRRSVREAHSRARERVAAMEGFLRHHRPDQLLTIKRQRLDALAPRLLSAVRVATTRATQHLQQRAGMLRLLSPFATLERGYALAFSPEGTLIRSVSEVKPGDPLEVRIKDGTLKTVVNGTGTGTK